MTNSVLERVASGDTQAVAECLQRYGPLVWALARRYSPDAFEAEDAVQEVFVDLWRNAARFDGKRASEATFITVIARRRLIDRNRRRERSPVTSTLPEQIPDLPLTITGKC